MKGLRTVPVVLELAEETSRLAAQAALIVDFTNPTGMVTQALIDAGHRAVGLCNAAIGIQRRVAAVFGVQPERVQLGHVGLNHLSWVRKTLVDRTERLPEIVSGLREGDGRFADLSEGHPAELIRGLGAIPSSYFRYYYETDRVLEEERAGHIRANEVMEIEEGLLELYRDPALDRKPDLLERRGALLADLLEVNRAHLPRFFPAA